MFFSKKKIDILNMFKINIENLNSELNLVKDLLDLKLNELKLKGISKDNLNFIKDIFIQTLEKENLNLIDNKKKTNHFIHFNSVI